MKRSFRTIFRPALAVLLLAQLAACSRPSHEQSGEADSTRPADSVRGANVRGDTATVTDDLGRTLRVSPPARHIVSLAPSLTEMLFFIGAGESVAGVTSYCDFPPEARTRQVVGDLVTPDIERILSLRPDLVLISVEGNAQRSFQRLEQLGMRMFVSNPRDLAGVYKSLADIAALTGHARRAAALIDSLRGEERRLREHAPARSPSVLMLLSLQPLMAAGRSTFIDEVITLAGGRNAAAALEGNYPTLNRETLLRMDPDLILLPDDMGINETQLRTGFPEWRRLRARRGDGMHRIDADRYLRPGPRLIEAARELQRMLAKGK